MHREPICILPGERYEMGEEKPEEELMGKRKSSPRLDSHLSMVSVLSWPIKRVHIHQTGEKSE
jgi:hypothetical protein